MPFTGVLSFRMNSDDLTILKCSKTFFAKSNLPGIFQVIGGLCYVYPTLHYIGINPSIETRIFLVLEICANGITNIIIIKRKVPRIMLNIAYDRGPDDGRVLVRGHGKNAFLSV